MSNLKYDMMKVFDCLCMPKDVRTALFETEMARCNDVCIEYCVENNGELLNTWLIENGANDDEQVIIKWWW